LKNRRESKASISERLRRDMKNLEGLNLIQKRLRRNFRF
jgi:hypothetical protein